MAILGLGHIGQVLAKLAQAFGMQVIGYDPYLKSSPVKWYDDLQTFLPLADFVSINMPLTAETQN